MRAAPYLAAILALIAFQTAFGIYVRVTTGSHLTPIIFESVSAAFGMWCLALCFIPLVAGRGLDRDRLIPSFVENLKAALPNLLGALAALSLVMLSLAMMNWNKSMIPAFTVDHMLADFDRALFGVDPALIVRVPVLDRVMAVAYAMWMPIVFGFLIFAAYIERFAVIVSMVLVTAIDTVVQFTLPSAGPIFWERLGYGERFAYLTDQPSAYQDISNILWEHYQSGVLAVGTGISAFPSMHVALSAWMALSFPKARIVLVPFFLLIFAGSVASGWHYFSDGVAGCVMAYAAHRLVHFRKAGVLSPQFA